MIRIVLAAILLMVSLGHAAEIRLAWDPNSEADLAGYKVYWGLESRKYGAPLNAGNVTLFTVLGLDPTVNYFFAVTAYDTANNESGYSNEVSGLPQFISPSKAMQLEFRLEGP